MTTLTHLSSGPFLKRAPETFDISFQLINHHHLNKHYDGKNHDEHDGTEEVIFALLYHKRMIKNRMSMINGMVRMMEIVSLMEMASMMEMASLTEMVSIINGNGEQDGIVSMVEMVCTMKIVE